MSITMYLILLISGLLFAKYIYKRFSREYFLLSKLPSPPALPFLGHGLLLNRSRSGLWNIFQKLCNEYYPIVYIWAFSESVVIISHPDDIQVLVSSKTETSKANFIYSSASRCLENDGIFTSAGEKWRIRRKLMNPAFYRYTLKTTADSANKISELLIEQMLGWKDGSIENMIPLMLKFTLDVVCDTMGCDLHSAGAPDGMEYIMAFKKISNGAVNRAFRPYIPNWMYTILPEEQERKRLIKTVKDFMRKVIEVRLNYLKTNGTNVLLDDVINDDDTADDLKSTEGKFSNDLNVVDLLYTYNTKGIIDEAGMMEELELVIIAAFEATGMTLSYTLLLLAENENEQNLARKEVSELMQKTGNKLTISDIQNLPYLDRCIKESLRFFPPGPKIGRHLLEDIKLGDYIIPRDTDLMMNVFDVHRDPNFWTEPNKFNPDRFLPEFSKNRHPHAYLPFSGGIRSCIGQKHGVVQMKVVLAHILNNFYLKPIDFSSNLQLAMSLINCPKSDQIRVQFIKI